MGCTILYGYRIVGGKAVVNDEEAEMIRTTAENYLSGMSFVKAAEAAGLTRNHGTVRKMLENPNYLGTDFYPAILDEKTFYAIAVERNKRIGWIDRDTQSKKIPKPLEIHTDYKIPKKVEQKYTDPYLQAEYAYSLIQSEVK